MQGERPAQAPEIPDKVFFKIGEVSRILEVPEHTLRYWEDEFSQVRPQKTRSGQRLYRRRDIEILLQIKQLLWEQKFKIAGARERLRHLGTVEREEAENREQSLLKRSALEGDVNAMKETMSRIRHEVQELLALVNETDCRGVAQSG